MFIRKARAEAKRLGHDLGRFREGNITAIAVCKNGECPVMVELLGYGSWRMLDLRHDRPNDPCRYQHL